MYMVHHTNTKLVKFALSTICVAAMSLGFAQGVKHAAHKITEKQAIRLATQKFRGRSISKPVLENEEGKWEYGVMVKSGKTLREVMVGADSGNIENVEVVTLKQEAAEKAAEAKGGHKAEVKREKAEKAGHVHPAHKKPNQA
jgi:hypothetical protein